MSDIPIILFDDNMEKGKVIKSSLRKENRLLKGILIHPDSLRSAAKFAGIHTMADAYRTLDRLALRKDYQMTLVKHGVDMDFIVSQLKTLSQVADLDSTRLKALQIFLKSLGLDTYGKEEEGPSGWEKTVAKAIETTDTPALPAGTVQKYEVNIPLIPQEAQQQREEEDQLGKELYE